MHLELIRENSLVQQVQSSWQPGCASTPRRCSARPCERLPVNAGRLATPGLLGPSWRLPGALVGPFLRSCWGLAGALQVPCWSLPGALLGPSYGLLRPRAFLGPCWGLAGAFPGPCWGFAGAFLGPFLGPSWRLPSSGLPRWLCTHRSYRRGSYTKCALRHLPCPACLRARDPPKRRPVAPP